MLDFLMPEKHAISILKKDHDTVKDLFEKFEKAESSAEKERIIAKAVNELKIHAVIEEEIFYPTVRKHVGSDIMNEADEEHHVAKVLIAELDQNRGGGDHREAKFTVLAESVRHHIKEEENEMMPKAKDLDIDFEALGQKMLDRKAELKDIGKAYSGLTDAEISEMDRFVRTHTTGRFGPVHAVEPLRVFELGFEAIQSSDRHKSGIAVRLPRILRLRMDKKPQDADTIHMLRELLATCEGRR